MKPLTVAFTRKRSKLPILSLKRLRKIRKMLRQSKVCEFFYAEIRFRIEFIGSWAWGKPVLMVWIGIPANPLAKWGDSPLYIAYTEVPKNINEFMNMISVVFEKSVNHTDSHPRRPFSVKIVD